MAYQEHCQGSHAAALPFNRPSFVQIFITPQRAQISSFLRKNIHEPPEYISFLSYLQNLILLPYIIQSKIFTGVYSNSKNKWEFTLFRYSDKGQIGYIFNIISNSEIYNKACANEFFKLSPKLPNEIHRKILQVFLLATKNSSKSDS